MSEQPYQPPVQQPAQPEPPAEQEQPETQPVPAGEPVTITPAEQPAGSEPDDEQPQDETQTAAVGFPGEHVDPPAGGPGQQSLAEQQAAGSNVTADVPQPETGPGGSSPYAQPAASYPAEVTGDGPVATQPAGNATSNESPMLPGNLVSGAARAHAALSTASDVTSDGEASEGDRISRLRQIIDFALNELDRYLPQHVRQPAADEVGREL